ncbi:MAG: kinase [Woeseiaceae bacterium]|nr:kinase [Woeseiaceae bacterium]
MAGAQGAGKSTFALFLANWLAHETGLRSIRVSLDDFYFGKAMRATLAQTVHPLLATRGVPGTHDVEAGRRALKALTDTDDPGPVTLPAFDKGSDERLPGTVGPVVDAPVDVVVFEGWCVGARPQPSELLAEPLNVLEAEGDPTGRWRGYVNERLAGDYAALFETLDALVYLRVPSFEKVREWRRRQEHELRERRPGAGQTDAELAIFIMHYERLTRHMLDSVPGYADTVIDIDAGHRFAALAHPGWGGLQSDGG